MQDPAIKQMAEQLAQDPNFKQMTEQLQGSFPAADGSNGAVGAPRAPPDMAALMSGMSGGGGAGGFNTGNYMEVRFAPYATSPVPAASLRNTRSHG